MIHLLECVHPAPSPGGPLLYCVKLAALFGAPITPDEAIFVGLAPMPLPRPRKSAPGRWYPAAVYLDVLEDSLQRWGVQPVGSRPAG